MMWRLRPLFAAAALAAVLLLSTAARAREIRVGVGFAIAPYALREQDAGLEVDLLRAAFRAAGMEARFVYLPNLRLPLALAEGDVDCLATSAGYDMAERTGRPVFYSGPTLTFRNYAVTLADRDLRIRSIADLSGYVVLGFQDAASYLGPEFAAMARGNDLYSELSDQSLQVRMLFSGRVDVVLSERRVFLYWRNRLKGSPAGRAVDLDQAVTFHAIFPAQDRQVVFVRKSLCDDFDRGMAAIRESGSFDRIVRAYDRAEYVK
ncbi:Bacterial extracellular solute-binding protein, family 3 [Pseudodesulfovibrio hydrargyri]|uniref:Bacterial extracellular solute-binding protein, family 3 n=1 Tax=Pseudodesulfovibrio hydrargyri TaxID=2125990 RepID=A0A1J5NBT9_9BACT|nr:transporter substrate-binding domain-containing protein [Pseudodesulfovibrio hydrargyri]OIQ49201.1 Bacterial extracellular solute-binding protein, family 3 [Pseudodesulfovibrio hydrargyri]